MEQVAQAAPGARSSGKRGKVKTLNQGYWQRYWVFYTMMAPGLLVMLVNNYIPMIGTTIAFKNIRLASRSFFTDFMNSPWVGWDNFRYLFTTSDAWLITRNTVAYNAVFIVLNLVIGVAFALMFHNMRNRLAAKVHQTLMFLPYFLSMVIVAYLVYGFLHPDIGIMNRVVLPLFGAEPRMWYQDTTWWPLILPLVNTWKSIGYYAIFYLAAIIGIDQEYYEAAHIDGASKWKQVWSITVPLIRPIIIILTLLQIGRIFYADFGLFFQVTQNSGALYDKTLIIDTYVYQGFLVTGNIGMSAAAGIYQAVVGFVLVFLSNLIVRRISKDDALF